MAVQTISKNFEETVLKAGGPVVVDFWAPWCGYCRRLAPAVDRVAEEYEDELEVVKIDIDEEPKLAEEYGIETIPTLVLFEDGKVVDSVVNPQSQDEIEEWLKENGALK